MEAAQVDVLGGQSAVKFFGLDQTPVRVLSRERLHAAVWGEPISHPDGPKVDVNVCAVRRRLAEVSPDWEYIHTNVGRGYRFEPRRKSR